MTTREQIEELRESVAGVKEAATHLSAAVVRLTGQLAAAESDRDELAKAVHRLTFGSKYVGGHVMVDAGEYSALVVTFARVMVKVVPNAKLCPKCGFFDGETTTMGSIAGPDPNRAKCRCGWTGKATDLEFK